MAEFNKYTFLPIFHTETPDLSKLLCRLRFRDFYVSCDFNMQVSSCQYVIEGDKHRLAGSITAGETTVRILHIKDFNRLLISADQPKISYRGEFVQSDIQNCSAGKDGHPF